MATEHRVYGPPGCGKTTYLSGQARRAVEKFGAHNVAIASLTKTAAQEVAGRDTGVPGKNVGTLHSHAFRAVDHPDVADVPEGFADWNRHVGSGPLRIRQDLTIDADGPPTEAWGGASDGELLLAEYGVMRNRMTPRELWRPRLVEFAEKWEGWKRASGRLDFTDMIERAAEEAPTIPGDPAVFMLDEAQDLSRLEMKLARRWGDACDHFVIVGDPDQNLYEWRGSDPAAFTAADAESETVLSQSYRVPVAVHEYAVDWIERIDDRPPVRYEPRRSDPSDPDSAFVAGELDLARANWTRPEPLIKRAVEEAYEEGRSVMFLTTCGYMLEPLIRVLKDEGVPFHNPYRVKQGAWNPMRSAHRVLSFLRPDPEAWGDEARFWSWDDLKSWTEPLLAKGVIKRGSKALIESKATRGRFDDENEPEVLKGLNEALEHFEEEHWDPIFEMELDWWLSKLRTKRKKAYLYPLEVAAKRGKSALRETPRIVVGTIHSVKGAEADSVYVFPDLSRRGADEIHKPGGREATIRQFYVGFTRAREKLTICRPAAADYVKLPSP